MKKQLVVLISLIFLASLFYAQEITFTSPKGGEEYCRGKDTIHITWNSVMEYRDSLIKISLVDLGINKIKIAENIANSGSYDWPIPDTVDASRMYLIRIKPKDFPRTFDSEKFQIQDCNYPDLVVEETWVDPKPRTMGNKITYMAEVKNAKTQGQAALAPASKAQLKIYRPQGLSPITVPPFDVKAFSKFNRRPDTLRFSFIPRAYGIYKYELKLDINNNVEEGDGESNNTDTHLSSVNPGPDLIVCLTCGKEPHGCKKTTITAWVRNIGDMASKPSTLLMFVKERGTTPHAVPRLEPNEMVRFKRSAKYCDPAHYGYKTMWAHINKDKSVIETDYDNNYVQTRYRVKSGYSRIEGCRCKSEYKTPWDLGITDEIPNYIGVCCSIKKLSLRRRVKK